MLNTLFNKHFWAVKLAGLALLALATAGVVSVIIGAQFFALPAPPAGASAPGEAAERASDGRIPVSIRATADLQSRRIFDADWPAKPDAPEKDADSEQTEAEKAAERAAAMRGGLEPSKLPITLVGTFVAAIPDYSYANLQIQGDNKIASVGSTYLEGQATVMRIAPGHIILRESGGFTYITVWQEKNPAAASPNDPASLKQPMPGGRPAPVSARPEPADSIAGGVTKTGAYDYKVERSMIDRELADMAKLQREARVVPHFKDNQYQGFKLVGVRPGSLYRSLGIRSGDIITSVNGTAIDNPGKALELFEQLKTSSNIAVDIERRGQPRQLNYNIQ